MKKRVGFPAGLLLAATLVASLFLACQDQGQPVRVAKVMSKVEAHSRSTDEWEPATVGLVISRGGQVRTDAASAARLDLLEGTVRLSAETLLTVKESAERGEQAETTLFLHEGRLWADLTIGRSHAFAIETDGAIATVGGTQFTVQVANGRTLVSVVEGAVELTAQEQTVVVSAGQQAQADSGQPPTGPEAMSTEELALWATEGGMPELAPTMSMPTSTPTPTSTSTPTPTPTPTSTPTPTPTVTPMPIPTETPTPAPTTALLPGLSTLSGEWAGTATIFQVGSCTHTSEGKPRPITLRWAVTDRGDVEIEEAETKHWSGTITGDLSLSLVKSFSVTCQGEPRTGTASYEGRIVQEDGRYSLEIEAIEDWCPPTCRFRLVYSLTKE